jgi:hypothetical protein
VGFEDPSGKEEAEYLKTYEELESVLLPKIKEALGV